MKLFSRLATAGVVAVLGVGAGAATASAYSISGGAYTGSATADHTSTFGGAYMFECPAALTTYSGTATGADTTSFTPYFGGTGNCNFFGLSASVTQSGPWNLKVVAGPDMNGYYDGELAIPAGTSTTEEEPLSGCSATISGPQAFRNGFSSTTIRMKNVGGDVTLEMDLNGIVYTATGTCFPSGSGGLYSTNGIVSIPGISIS
jgi:hypothetical protein